MLVESHNGINRDGVSIINTLAPAEMVELLSDIPKTAPVETVHDACAHSLEAGISSAVPKDGSANGAFGNVSTAHTGAHTTTRSVEQSPTGTM